MGLILILNAMHKKQQIKSEFGYSITILKFRNVLKSWIFPNQALKKQCYEL